MYSMETSKDERLPEYKFDYTLAKPNRFASQTDPALQRMAILDEDAAQDSCSDESELVDFVISTDRKTAST